ncbi:MULTISPECIES: hypothetical protein [Pseudidiomarina]|uniref:Uncharacterized protein n=3 Tax=Pseudidiomarina TaxID=2800384 RepID=A0A368UL55_9GAMM|nr:MULTISPECIES: hypothetical protein [Pseudidiomarina]MDX1526917.1 hypothetical protein [Pseudidiomarina maritima]PWW05909.1 hypothetical protein DET45_1402 [Pseudidiomarina maritima]RBP86281.1 hypothetical protein DFO81_1352 [Pseudidiomarina tainanensis]RCW27515.1 hypothetical protein DFO79_1352 [Pseudidiomarina tainanensis]
MFREYFEDWEVRPEYSKEFISLWKGWLGKENYHKLDEVTENEWARFNELLRRLAEVFVLEVVNCEKQSLERVSDIESVLSTCEESMNKESSEFTTLVIPDLECVISEEWDYTYIIWHKNNGAVEALAPYIKAAGLEHFHD